MHTCRYGSVTPKTNRGFWQTKRTGNARRDRTILLQLRADGWDVLTVWECETKNRAGLEGRLRGFLIAPVRAMRGARRPRVKD